MPAIGFQRDRYVCSSTLVLTYVCKLSSCYSFPDAIPNCLHSPKRLLVEFYLARLEERDSGCIYTSVLWTKPKWFSLYENQGIHILQIMSSKELFQKRQIWNTPMEYPVFHDHSKPQQLFLNSFLQQSTAMYFRQYHNRCSPGLTLLTQA